MASWARRFGRKPYEDGWKSASKIGSSTSFNEACTIRSAVVGTMASYCLLGRGPWGLGLGDGLDAPRRGDRGAAPRFDVGSETDEQATAGTSPGDDVTAFDPVVDDVRADAEHRGDLCDGELLVGLRVGGVGLVDVR